MREMMNVNRCYLFFVLFAMSVTTLQAQIDTISPKRLVIKGKVKKIEDYSYYLEANTKGDRTIGGKKFNIFPLVEDWYFGKLDSKDAQTNISYEFDRSGKNTNITTYYSEGNPFGVVDFMYDLTGKLVKSQTCFRVSDGDFMIDKNYTYDNNKRLVKIDEYEGNQMLQTVTFEYDKLGNCVEKNKASGFFQLKEGDFHQTSDRIREKYTKNEQYKYNSSKKVTFSEETLPEHNIFLRVEKEYCKRNKLVKAKFLNQDDKETECLYVYDKDGRLTQTVCTAKDDATFFYQQNTLYGAAGKTEIIKSKDGKVLSKKVFDANGLLKLHRTPDFDYQYKYSFDTKGNWKESVLYEQGKPTKIRVRKIEYY